MKKFFDYFSGKTFKREISLFLVGMLAYQVYINNIGMVEVIIWPFLSFAAGSAGIHIYDKTTTNKREVMEIVE